MIFVLFILLALCSTPAHADMQYVPDPVYQSFDPADTSPMQDMIDLANTGDVRAQYILGDLYSKGKGGLAKDEKQGAWWFELAARNGYYEGFIRLAALAKHQGKPVEAYKWYTLAIHYMDYGAWRDHAKEAREELEKSHKFTSGEYDEAKKEGNIWRSGMETAAADEKKREADAAIQRQKEIDAAEKKTAAKKLEREKEKEKKKP